MTNSTWLIILGLLLAAAGILTLLHPFPASLTVELFAGWSFLVLGVLQIFAAFRAAIVEGRVWLLLIGLAMVVIGVALLRNPFAGLMALTVLIALSFIASGVFKLSVGRTIWGGSHGWAVVLSGVVSVLLGVLVLANIWPSAAVLLGVLLGIELLSNGLTLLVLGLAAKRLV